ncbi:hypothetical protein RDI58_003208 [Solanum bulbocastanum]|uniref:PPM-type phosphatase domain-containing protein n=1 Tax=Solanum bulbocastanum TaxID=147425 RepID=A0AAN8YPN0_SOLBU
MADSLCKFLDARRITGSQFFGTYFSAQKPLLFPTLVRRKRRRKSLHIAFCSTPISLNLDVVSTYEHSDGTLLFRFGDPSEIAKEDELEEPHLGVEEVGRDSEEEFSVVKVLDGENEREVIVKKVEREARGEAVTVVTDAGVSESVVIGNGRSDFVEVETGLSENSVDEIGSISAEGIQSESVAEVDIENAGHVEEIFEKKDDSEASVPPPPDNSIPSLEVEEEMMGQSSDESLEELDDDKSLLLSSPTAMPVYSDSVNTKEIEESEGEGSSQLTENDGGKDCCDDSTPSMENGAASVDIEAADNDIEIVQWTEQISENIDPILEGPAKSVPEGINLGNTETIADEISPENAPEGINLGNTETVVDGISSDNAPEGNDQGNSETVVDEISLENSLDGIDLGNTETAVDKISPENALGGINLGNTETVVDEISPDNVDIRHLSMDAEDQSIEVLNFENDDQTELSNLSVDTEDQASRNSTFKDSDETEVMPDCPKLEAEPVFDEEVDHNLISESNESESPLPSDENLPSLSLEEKRKEDVENTEIMEVYDHEVVEDKYSEVLDSSKEATPAAAELILSSGATLLQYPSKAFAGGHEAYFIACGKWLGVADAVGTWSLEGSDPGVYAQELMQNSESIVSKCNKDSINDPKQVLNLSISKTDSPGSSTVLIAHFDGKALHVANIGDSGFIIVRNGSVYRKSSPMLHEFNLPIQIEKGDDPSQLLEEYKIELDEGDVIVTATDALFDNLYDQEIVSIVSRSLKADQSPQEIAEILATRVQQVGSSASGRSPFADAAQAAGYVGYTGGKRDDVAVIVSVVQKVIVSNDNYFDVSKKVTVTSMLMGFSSSVASLK